MNEGKVLKSNKVVPGNPESPNQTKIWIYET